jgi:hypothetical protein
MRNTRPAFRTLLVVLALAPAPFVGLASAQEPQIAFVNVNVITKDGETLTKQTVFVSGERIVAVGPFDTIGIPQGAQRIESDAPRYLMPGMAELHGHIPPPADSQEYTENVLFLYVANGVTTSAACWGIPASSNCAKKPTVVRSSPPRFTLPGPRSTAA